MYFSTDWRYPEENANLSKSCSRRGETLILQGAGMKKLTEIMLKSLCFSTSIFDLFL